MARQRYRELSSELRRLRRELLPKKFDQLGNYKPRVQTLTRAYLLLAHAAIEEYLEYEAKQLTLRAQDLWTKQGRVTRPLATLLACRAELVPPPKLDHAGRFAHAAARVVKEHFERIKDNNGVKEQNVVGLFGPLGVPANAYGAILLGDLNSFGKRRGNHAHAGGNIVTYLDPQTESQRVDGLLTELDAFRHQIRAFAKQEL